MNSIEGPVLIVVRDGWGVREERPGNAPLLASTPRHDEFQKRFPSTLVDASEHHVGLPPGQMGNSEVGHMSMGAGRTIYHDLVRINNDIEEGSFQENPALVQTMLRAEERNRALHLLGLCSDGGVHSHLDHLRELLLLARKIGVRRVYIHPLLDGRDTPPRSGRGYLQRLLGWCSELGVGQVATLGGRFYGMDRDKRWDRVQLAYDALVHARGPTTEDPLQALEASYAAGKGDEFVLPHVVTGADGKPIGPLQRGDQVLAFNFRADRMRQLCASLACAEFAGFPRGHQLAFELTTLTQYGAALPLQGLAYPPKEITGHLSAYVSGQGLEQFKCAETEKYAHVTFFWNGGVEEPCPGEARHLIPSPRVRTYDQEPAMRAREVSLETEARIQTKDDALLVVNFANADMVGHTGKIDAAIAAVEAVDEATGRVVDAILAKGGSAIITADHGNCEMMLDPQTGEVHTAHTLNPVHAILCGRALSGREGRSGGSLADIAPTALELLGLPAPTAMTGQSLLL